MKCCSDQGEMSHPLRLKDQDGWKGMLYVFNEKRDILSKSQSETTISVIDRRTLGGEEKQRRWFKFLSSGKSSSIWGVAESKANSHALTGP